MSDRMTLIPFDRLMLWILKEKNEQGTVFGVHHAFKADPDKTLPIFTEKIETPFGPAAGPNTQLAQNIVASYYACLLYTSTVPRPRKRASSHCGLYFSSNILTRPLTGVSSLASFSLRARTS